MLSYTHLFVAVNKGLQYPNEYTNDKFIRWVVIFSTKFVQEWIQFYPKKVNLEGDQKILVVEYAYNCEGHNRRLKKKMVIFTLLK